MSGGIVSAIAIPTGQIVSHGGSTTSPPQGYLFCDGSAISRTTFASLFTAIGTNFGIGDGSTTFNLPDLRQKYPKGVNSGDAGSEGGENTVTLTISQMPVHNHQQRQNTTGALSNWSNATAGQATPAEANQPTTKDTGGGSSHNNEPAFQEVVWVIKT